METLLPIPNNYYNIASATSTKTIYDNQGNMVASIEANGLATSTYYIHQDYLGNVNVETSNLGAAVEVSDYYPFGTQRINQKYGSYTSKRKFIGEEYDVAKSLSYLNSRYYDSRTGQFVSQDPVFWELGEGEDGKIALLDPQLQNSYSYARNNPVTLSDPEGRIVPLIVAVWGLAEVGLSAYDMYSTAGTLVDRNASLQDKLTSGTLTIAGIALPGGGYGKGGKELLKIFKQTNREGRALMEGVEHTKVLNLIKDNYRSGATVGKGSTADAVRFEIEKVGERVGGRLHSMKARETLNRINNIFKKYGSELNSQERRVLNVISTDLKKALSGKR